MNSIRKNDLLLLALGIVVFAVLQGLISARIIGSFWQLNLLIIGINVIMSVSLNLINGYTGQFSLGHAGFMAVGAYVGVVLTTNFHAPFIVALVAGGLVAAFWAFSSACRRCGCAVIIWRSLPLVWGKSSASLS